MRPTAPPAAPSGPVGSHRSGDLPPASWCLPTATATGTAVGRAQGTETLAETGRRPGARGERHGDVDVPSWLAPSPAPPGPPTEPGCRRAARPRPPSPPEPQPVAASTLPDPAAAEVARDRSWGAARWILLIGFGLVAVALGVIANQAWLMGIPQSWVWWSSIAVVPPGLTALAALFGWRHAPVLAVAASVCTVVLAAVGLLRQPPVGLPQAVCAIAAVAVTMSARAVGKAAGPAPMAGDVSGDVSGVWPVP